MDKKQEITKWRRRRTEIMGLREKGVSYGKIGKIYNISPQRVEQIVRVAVSKS